MKIFLENKVLHSRTKLVKLWFEEFFFVKITLIHLEVKKRERIMVCACPAL